MKLLAKIGIALAGVASLLVAVIAVRTATDRAPAARSMPRRCRSRQRCRWTSSAPRSTSPRPCASAP